MLLMSSVGHW